MIKEVSNRSFKIFSVNHTNRVKPITWEEKKDAVGVVLKNTCIVKTPIMKVDNYSVVLSSSGLPTSNIYNMKYSKKCREFRISGQFKMII